MLLMRPPGVYPAQADTFLLIDSLGEERLGPASRVLDLGTGSGAVAIAAARRGARVTAVDVSRRALATAWLNAGLHRRRISVRRGNLLDPVRDQRFDLVVSNPPYVPSAGDRLPSRGPARAWDAGPTGRALVDRICREAPGVLAPGGVLLLVQSSLCKPSATCDALERAGLRVRVAARMFQPFGPVMRARAAWFEDQGLVRSGERREELVVIRGERGL